MPEKIKALFLSDIPTCPSGVGTQSNYLIRGLLATGRYSFLCLGGAMKHPDHRPFVVDPDKYGQDFRIIPVDGYGDKQLLRRVLIEEKPDVVFFFTDPRFWTWLWEMEDEVRAVAPMVYWHVWDANPTPDFNKVLYESTDYIGTISLLTHGILQALDYPKERYSYIPHAVPADVFKPIPEEEALAFKRETFGPLGECPFVVFWNNRNARRKMTGDVIESVARLAKRVGKEKVGLVMHTDPLDQEGQNILALAKMYDIEKQMVISNRRVEPRELNLFYNACDVTLNISNAEGFGLGTLESLMAGTPIVVNMTGGLQFQVGDWWKDLTDFSDTFKLEKASQRGQSLPGTKWFGWPVYPAVRSCTGHQQVPYIYEEKVNDEQVSYALEKAMNIGRSRRREMGKEAAAWARETFDMEKMVAVWDAALQEQVARRRSSPPAGYRLSTV